MNEKTDPREKDDALQELLRKAGPRPAVSQERLDRIRSAVHSQWVAETGVRKRNRTVFAAICAVAAIIAFFVFRSWIDLNPPANLSVVATVEILDGGASRIRNSHSYPLKAGDSLSVSDRLETGSASRALLRFADGSTFRINFDSAIEVVSAEVFSLEKGAVYLESAGNQSVPEVQIQTSFGSVIPTGTQFEVRVLEERLRVRVREGSVRVVSGNDVQNGKRGTEIQLDRSGRFSQTSIPVYGAEWQWASEIAPPFEMEGHTLRDYLQWVTRENGWQLRYASQRIAESAGSIVLHGNLARVPPAETVSAVLPVSGLTHTLQDGTLTVRMP